VIFDKAFKNNAFGDQKRFTLNLSGIFDTPFKKNAQNLKDPE